jgi:branched-chain amino acid transport system substrate-binding protein
MPYIIDYINEGGALGKFELVPFDNKSQPSDALIALKSATDRTMPFIMQCSGQHRRRLDRRRQQTTTVTRTTASSI